MATSGDRSSGQTGAVRDKDASDLQDPVDRRHQQAADPVSDSGRLRASAATARRQGPRSRQPRIPRRGRHHRQGQPAHREGNRGLRDLAPAERLAQALPHGARRSPRARNRFRGDFSGSGRALWPRDIHFEPRRAASGRNAPGRPRKSETACRGARQSPGQEKKARRRDLDLRASPRRAQGKRSAHREPDRRQADRAVFPLRGRTRVRLLAPVRTGAGPCSRVRSSKSSPRATGRPRPYSRCTSRPPSNPTAGRRSGSPPRWTAERTG